MYRLAECIGFCRAPALSSCALVGICVRTQTRQGIKMKMTAQKVNSECRD